MTTERPGRKLRLTLKQLRLILGASPEREEFLRSIPRGSAIDLECVVAPSEMDIAEQTFRDFETLCTGAGMTLKVTPKEPTMPPPAA